MEQHFRYTCNLEEEIKNILAASKLNQQSSDCKLAEVVHVLQTLKNVIGVVKMSASPNYSLTLMTGTATNEPFVLPLTVVDIAKELCNWISVVGKTILIHKLSVVCEKIRLTQPKNLQEINNFNLVVKWEDIKIIEDSDFSKTKTQMKAINSEDMYRNNCQRMMVHHVSLPFCDSEAVLCLVLMSLINSNNFEKKSWLVLERKQVAWREFLIPNREYIIKFHTQTKRDSFIKSFKPLDAILSGHSKGFEEIFHHKRLFSTFSGSFLPYDCKIFFTRNTNFSHYVNEFAKDPLCTWYSADEVDHASAELVTLYGQVDCVKYDEGTVTKSCCLCVRARPKEPVITQMYFFPSYSWTNPWKSQYSLTEDKFVVLPCSDDDSDNIVMKTGVPGNMVQIIKLRDLISGNERCIYVKHSSVAVCQQLFRIIPGMVICVSHLVRRCSNSEKFYYIATLLSDFKVLAFPDKKSQCEVWGTYGLRHSFNTIDEQEKIWGVLETFNLAKVAITAKCRHCQAAFYHKTCSRACAVPVEFTSSTYAIVWLQIIHNNETMSMEKVLIKDDFVRELLCIPESIWQKLLDTAAEEEIVFFTNELSSSKNAASLDLKELLKLYCSIPKKHGKFYVCVKKLNSSAGDEFFYYCINLKPIDNFRLNFVLDLVKKNLCK